MDNNQYKVKIIDENNRTVLDENCYDWAVEGNHIRLYKWTQTSGYGTGFKEISLVYGIKQGDRIIPTKVKEKFLKEVK